MNREEIKPRQMKRTSKAIEPRQGSAAWYRAKSKEMRQHLDWAQKCNEVINYIHIVKTVTKGLLTFMDKVTDPNESTPAAILEASMTTEEAKRALIEAHNRGVLKFSKSPKKL